MFFLNAKGRIEFKREGGNGPDDDCDAEEEEGDFNFVGGFGPGVFGSEVGGNIPYVG